MNKHVFFGIFDAHLILNEFLKGTAYGTVYGRTYVGPKVRYGTVVLPDLRYGRSWLKKSD